MTGYTVRRWESERGVHEMAVRAPSGPVAGLVARYAGYSERADGVTRREVARSGVALVLGFGDPLFVSPGEGDRPRAVGAFVVGNSTRASLTRFSGRQLGVQVDLTPSGAYRLLGMPVDELTDEVVDLEAVLGRASRELLDRMASAPSWSHRFQLLDTTIGRAAVARPTLDADVAWLLAALQAGPAEARIDRLIDETGRSRRSVTARFRRQIGLMPKAYARLLRFERAVSALTGLDAVAPDRSLADVAATAGYYDQAHFNREFRSFAGCTPSRFLAEQDPPPDEHFVQDATGAGLLPSPA